MTTIALSPGHKHQCPFCQCSLIITLVTIHQHKCMLLLFKILSQWFSSNNIFDVQHVNLGMDIIYKPFY